MSPLIFLLALLAGACGEDADDTSSEDEMPPADDDSDDGLRVDAGNPEWTRTGIAVSFGDALAVTAGGTVRLSPDGPALGPGGADEACGLSCPGPGSPQGALLGRIAADGGGVPFLVGARLDRTVTQKGELELIVNDDTPSDNAGYFAVQVEVSPTDDDGDDDLPEECAPHNFARAVVDYALGVGGGYGGGAMPGNVLGPPAGKGERVPQLAAGELLSLGEGGWITLAMGRRIVDLPGPDLVVYENAFYADGHREGTFTEAAVVEVSQDGRTWRRFPFDFVADGPTGSGGGPETVPENFLGMAGIHPTYANCDPDGDGDLSDRVSPLDPDVGGGDAFDLADVGLDWAAYVRIVDTGHEERNPGSEIYDADGDLVIDAGYSFPPDGEKQGFDLDAVAVLHGGDDLEPD